MKPLIEWSDELAFGIPLIDEEHKTLIDMVNRVYELLEADRLEEAERFLVDSLLAYTQTHFQDEERYMEEIGYPDLERHRKVHQSFARLVMEEAEKVRGGAAGISTFCSDSSGPGSTATLWSPTASTPNMPVRRERGRP